MNAADNNPISQRMDDEALAWAVRLDRGALSPAEQAALAEWFAADPAHEWRLAHFQQFCAQLHGTLTAMEAEGLLLAADGPVPGGGRANLRRWLTAGLAAVSLALIVAWLAHRPKAVATQMAQRTSMTLADGSRVELNARSRILVRVADDERLVRLEEGEAFFAVAKDSNRHFVVLTPTGVVRVTGTLFNVRVQQNGAWRVTVLEGSVMVRPLDQSDEADSPAREVALVRYDQFAASGDRVELRRLTGEEAGDATAWRDGRVVFKETSLAEAIEAFAGYHGLHVTVAREVAGLPLGGRFTLDDFDQFLVALGDALPVRVMRSGDKVRILRR